MIGSLVSSTSPTETKIDGNIIPITTKTITIQTARSTGSDGTGRQFNLTKTSTAQAFVKFLKVNGASQTGTSLNIKDSS